MVALLEVGDLIDLVATDPQGRARRVVAAACRCSRSRPPTTDAGGGRAGRARWSSSARAPADVTRLADAGVRLFLTYALRPLAWPRMSGFKNFLLRGNLVELAVAVIMGVAFGAVVTAFTAWLTSQPAGRRRDLQGRQARRVRLLPERG